MYQPSEEYTRKSLVARIKQMRRLGAWPIVIRNTQIGMAVTRRGLKWTHRNPSAYQRQLEAKYGSNDVSAK